MKLQNNKIMKAKVILAVVLLVVTSGLFAQQTWTLQQCIDTALENNRSIKQRKLNYESRKIALEQAKANRLPDLNASASQSLNFGRSLGVDNTYKQTNSSNTSFGVSTGLMLFDGFRMKNDIEAKQAELLAAGADVKKIEKDIAMAVTTIYLQVLQNKEQLENTKKQLAITEESIKQKTELIKSGKLAEGEIYELQAQQAKEELQLVEATNRLKLSLLDLAQALELENYREMDVVVPEDLLQNELAVLSADGVYQSALTSRPEIEAAKYRLESSKKNVKIAKSGHLPSLRLGGQWGTGYYNLSQLPNNPSFANQFKNNMSYGLGLTLSIPIFNRFQVKNQIKSAELMVKSSELNIEDTKKELRKMIEQAYYNALGAKNRWKVAKKSVKANEESYRFASQKFEVGRANQYEVNLAKTNLSQSISDETQAKYEYFFRIKILEYYQ